MPYRVEWITFEANKIRDQRRVDLVLSVRVTRIEGSGADMKVFPGEGTITFKKDNQPFGQPVQTDVTDGSASIRDDFPASRQNSTRLDAHFRAVDGQVASAVTQRIPIPFLPPRDDQSEDDRRSPSLIAEFTAKLVQKAANLFAVILCLTLTRKGKGVSGKPVIFLNETGEQLVLENDAIPATDDRGQARITTPDYPAGEFPREVYFAARVKIDDNLTLHPFSKQVTIPAAKPEPKESCDLSLTKADFVPLGKDQFRISLAAKLTKSISGEKSDVANVQVTFFNGTEEIGSGFTDSKGQVFTLSQDMALPQHPRDLFVQARGATNDSDFSSDTLAVNVPGRKKEPRAKAILVSKIGRSAGNTYSFKVTPVSDPADPNSAVESVIQVQGEVPGQATVGANPWRSFDDFQVTAASAIIKVQITQPGARGNMVFALAGTAITSEPQYVKAEA